MENANLSLRLNKFLWTKKELCNLEKADQAGGYHWKRSDGSQWTNHNGQIVPYNPVQHGNRQEHPQAKAVASLHDNSSRKGFSRNSVTASANDFRKRAEASYKDAISNGIDSKFLDAVARHGEKSGYDDFKKFFKKYSKKS